MKRFYIPLLALTIASLFFIDLHLSYLIAAAPRSPWAKLTSLLGSAPIQIAIWLAILSYSLLRERFSSLSFDVLSKLSGCIIMCYILKVAIGRARPEWAPLGFAPFTMSNLHYSMPSSHSAIAMVVALSIGEKAPRWKGVAIGLALITAASRILLLRHFLSDVVLGILIALLVHNDLFKWGFAQRIQTAVLMVISRGQKNG